MSRDTYTRADRLNGHPETPRQKTERYRAAVEITGTPKRSTYVKPSDPWVPLYIAVALTGVLFVVVTVAVIVAAINGGTA